MAGEEIAGIWLVFSARHFPIPLSLGPAILLDYLARHRWLAESALQIEGGLRADLFSLRHGINASTSRKQTRRFHRSTIKEYVKRIRQVLGVTFAEARLNIDPTDVLVSEVTSGNEVRYRLKAMVNWTHC